MAREKVAAWLTHQDLNGQHLQSIHLRRMHPLRLTHEDAIPMRRVRRVHLARHMLAALSHLE